MLWSPPGSLHLTVSPGLGKTTAARLWTASLNPSRFKVVYSSLSTLTVMDFYRQRIVMNYHMGGMTKEEGRCYINRKLEGAGSRQTVFDENAMEAVINAANGTARMINKICSRTLMVGADHGRNIIDAETVRIAVEDNQLG